MPDATTSRRRLAVVAALVLAALLAAVPGSHLLALWLDERPAIVVSHGVGLALLVAAVWRWRASGSSTTA